MFLRDSLTKAFEVIAGNHPTFLRARSRQEPCCFESTCMWLQNSCFFRQNITFLWIKQLESGLTWETYLLIYETASWVVIFNLFVFILTPSLFSTFRCIRWTGSWDSKHGLIMSILDFILTFCLQCDKKYRGDNTLNKSWVHLQIQDFTDKKQQKYDHNSNIPPKIWTGRFYQYSWPVPHHHQQLQAGNKYTLRLNKHNFTSNIW